MKRLIFCLIFSFLFAGTSAYSEDFDPAQYTTEELQLIVLESRLQLLKDSFADDPCFLYEDDYIIVHYISLETDFEENQIELMLLLTNKTDTVVTFVLNGIVVNGYSTEIYEVSYIPQMSSSISVFSGNSEVYEFYPISSIDEISLLFEFYDCVDREFDFDTLTSDTAILN